MTVHERVGGVWKEVPDINERVAGTYKAIIDGWERVGGVWKKFYARTRLKLTAVDYEADFLLTLNLLRAGGLNVKTVNEVVLVDRADEWVEVGRTAIIGDSYECRLTLDPGSWDIPFSNAGPGVWTALNEDRFWTLFNDQEFRGTLEIRRLGETAVLVTKPVHLKTTAYYFPP